MYAGITLPHHTLLPQMDAPYGLPKGWQSLCPECKSLMGQQAGALGKVDAFLEDRCAFWMTLAISLRTVVAQGQTRSLLMVAALEHKFSFFPLHEVCTLGIFFIFDFPFLSGKEEAKIIYFSLCCELLGHNKNERRNEKIIAKFRLLEFFFQLKAYPGVSTGT